MTSIFTNESSIGCSDHRKHKRLCLVNTTFSSNNYNIVYLQTVTHTNQENQCTYQDQRLGRILGIIDRQPSVSKSNWVTC